MADKRVGTLPISMGVLVWGGTLPISMGGPPFY